MEDLLPYLEYTMWLIDEIKNVKLTKETQSRTAYYRQLAIERASKEEHADRQEVFIKYFIESSSKKRWTKKEIFRRI